MLGLVGHKFPGGNRTIDRWENYLLTDCTTSPQLEDGLAHPIALFHIPIQGVQTSIAELFDLGRVKETGSVGLDGYDWEFLNHFVKRLSIVAKEKLSKWNAASQMLEKCMTVSFSQLSYLMKMASQLPKQQAIGGFEGGKLNVDVGSKIRLSISPL